MAKKTGGQLESRPIARTRAAGGSYEFGSFRDLEGRPGVVVLGSGASFPYQAGGLSRTLSAARSKYFLGMTQTIVDAYKGMDKRYRQYRSDSLVRGCINSLALWATKEGFDTVIEPVQQGLTPEQEQQVINQYLGLKAHVDRINQRVNLDHVLRAAIIKAKIWGKAGFEIEYDPKSKEPSRLISLPLLSQYDLRPHVDEDWNLQGFWWRGQVDFYKPGDILYFVNSAIESDYEGLSDIEPILDDLETRGKIRQEDLKEAATTLWAGVAIHSLDVDRLPAGLTQADVQAIIDEHVAALRPGKHIATDNRWSITVVDLKPDLQKLIEVKKELDQEIIGNFQVPKFILNRSEQVNRATSYSQLEAFVDGPISDIQRWIKRTIESQWYDQLARAFLKIPEGQELPIRVRHRWREIRTTDFFQLLNAVANAYNGGLGILDKQKGYELLREGPSAKFDPTELENLGTTTE